MAAHWVEYLFCRSEKEGVFCCGPRRRCLPAALSSSLQCSSSSSGRRRTRNTASNDGRWWGSGFLGGENFLKFFSFLISYLQEPWSVVVVSTITASFYTSYHCLVLHASYHCLVLHASYHCRVLHASYHCLVLHASYHCLVLHTSYHCLVLHTSYHCLVLHTSYHCLVLHTSYHCLVLHTSYHCLVLHVISLPHSTHVISLPCPCMIGLEQIVYTHVECTHSTRALCKFNTRWLYNDLTLTSSPPWVSRPLWGSLGAGPGRGGSAAELSHRCCSASGTASAPQTRSRRGPWHSSTHHWLWSTSCRAEPLEPSTWLGSGLHSMCSTCHPSGLVPCQSHQSERVTIKNHLKCCNSKIPAVMLPCRTCAGPGVRSWQLGLCARMTSLPGRPSQQQSLDQTWGTDSAAEPGLHSCRGHIDTMSNILIVYSV